jgi:hypothetical protein
VQDRGVAEATGGGQRHGVRGGVRVGGGQAEARRGRLADEEGGDGETQFVGEIARQDVAQDVGAAFHQESRDQSFGIKIGENVAEGRRVARVDDDGGFPEASPGGREGGSGAVDQWRARAGEEAGGRIQAARRRDRDAHRVRRPRGGFAAGGAGRRANQQARVVGADRAGADEDRVGRGAKLVHLVEVLRAGQDQPVRGPVVEATVDGDGAAQQRVGAARHGPHSTGRRCGFTVFPWQVMRYRPRCPPGERSATPSSR